MPLTFARASGFGATALVATAFALASTSIARADDDACSTAADASGCITSIKVIDPDTETETTMPNGAVEIDWSTAADGDTYVLPKPEPQAQAQAEAAQLAASDDATATARTLHVGRAHHTMGFRVSFADAKCATTAYTPTIAPNGANYHVHAKSTQSCGGNPTSNGISTAVVRDQTTKGTSYDNNFGGNPTRTDAVGDCHVAGGHNWWNWSSFSVSVGGRIYQGPQGFFVSRVFNCY